MPTNANYTDDEFNYSEMPRRNFAFPQYPALLRLKPQAFCLKRNPELLSSLKWEGNGKE